MPTAKKATTSAKSSATKATAPTKPTKTKVGAKKPIVSPGVIKKIPAAKVVVAQPITPKKVISPKKGAVKKTAASVSVTRTSNPRTNTVTIKKVTRNIVGFYMTEDTEIRRVTQSDNVSSEKLKAKYAQLKAKAKAKSR